MNDSSAEPRSTEPASVEHMVTDLIERDRILTLLTELFLATDAKQWGRVVRCFAPLVAFDMSSVGGGPRAPTRAAEIVAGWRAALDPIYAVHHQAGNYVITVSGTNAEAFCYGIAYHHHRSDDGAATRVFVGSYDFGLERVGPVNEPGWRITKLRFTLKFMDRTPSPDSSD
jgi:hypothetical protein